MVSVQLDPEYRVLYDWKSNYRKELINDPSIPLGRLSASQLRSIGLTSANFRWDKLSRGYIVPKFLEDKWGDSLFQLVVRKDRKRKKDPPLLPLPGRKKLLALDQGNSGESLKQREQNERRLLPVSQKSWSENPNDKALVSTKTSNQKAHSENGNALVPAVIPINDVRDFVPAAVIQANKVRDLVPAAAISINSVKELVPAVIQANKVKDLVPEVIPAHKVREAVIPAHKVREAVIPAHKVREEVIPANKVREEVIPAHNVREAVIPANNVREAVIPANNVREAVIPANNVREEVIPAHNVREAVIPANNVREAVIPANNVREAVIPAKNVRDLVPATVPRDLVPFDILNWNPKPKDTGRTIILEDPNRKAVIPISPDISKFKKVSMICQQKDVGNLSLVPIPKCAEGGGSVSSKSSLGLTPIQQAEKGTVPSWITLFDDDDTDIPWDTAISEGLNTKKESDKESSEDSGYYTPPDGASPEKSGVANCDKDESEVLFIYVKPAHGPAAATKLRDSPQSEEFQPDYDEEDDVLELLADPINDPLRGPGFFVPLDDGLSRLERKHQQP